MPARCEWKGFLQINQLQVAVKAFSTAATEPEISLNQLHRDCGQRIRQQKVCPIHGQIESEAIVSGYQIADDCYLPLDPDELEQLRPEPSREISVECFVDSQTIDPIYHTGRTLYLVPDGPPGQRPFGVIREGMKASGRYAFSRVVISGREKLVLLRPYGRLLAMTVVEYAHRVRASADYESEVATVVPGAAELKLIQQLIESLMDRQFDLSRYRDNYMDGLSAMIEERIATMDLTGAPRFSNSEETADDTALLALLKASLADAGVGRTSTVGNVGAPESVLSEAGFQEQKTA